jgi:putative membrane protein
MRGDNIMMILWVLLIPLIFYWFNNPGQPAANNIPTRDALDILRERYARGEIEFKEFEERQRELRKDL